MSLGRAHVQFTKIKDTSTNLQEEGTCYLIGTIPQNKPNWQTLPHNKTELKTPKKSKI